MKTQTYSTWRIYRCLLSEAKAFWGAIAGILLLNLLATPLRLLVPVPLKIAVDHVLNNMPLAAPVANWWPSSLASRDSLLIVAIILLLLVTLLSYLNALAIRVLHGYTAEHLVVRFRSRLFLHVQNLSLRYHDQQGSTESTYRIQYDAPCIQWIVLDGVIPFLTAIATVVTMFLVIMAIDWSLALIALILAPVLFVITHVWGKKLRRRWRSVKQIQSGAMSLVQESFSSIRIVKAFGSEGRERERFENQATAGLSEQLAVIQSQGLFDLIAAMIIACGTGAALYLGVRHVQAGSLTLGNFLLVWAYLGQLYGPLQAISNKITTLQGSMASAERVLALLDQTPEVVESPHPKPLSRCQGEISFHDVSFAYERDRPVLKHVTFHVPVAATVGIEGPSGVWKSTLMNLLLRFYDPTEGMLTLDGVDLREYRIADLRNQFSVVLQEPLLFHASIRENIAYGRPDVPTVMIR
jgi:ATP-binding cassette subfamily B protein